MANSKKQYWTGLEELNNSELFKQSQENEFPENVSVDEFLADSDLSKTTTGRRDFLKFLGFSVTAATIAACEAPVIKSIPYVNKPEEITPGVPTYYSSTYYDGIDYANILVKTREGRPIFIKPSRNEQLSRAMVSARVNSSLLSLYDSSRLKGPLNGGAGDSWSSVDDAIVAGLRSAAAGPGKIAILSNTIISPSTMRAIEEFRAAFNGGAEDKVVHVTYDSLSQSGIRMANERSFGRNVIPSYDFSKAKTIVSISADFLNNWLMHNEYMWQYGTRRNPENDWMSQHFQFESIMSLTGTNADHRFPIKPSQEGAVALALYNAIAGLSGSNGLGGDTGEIDKASINMAASALMKTRGESLVVAGSNNVHVQTLVNGINQMLGNYGSTIDLNKEIFIKQGNDQAVVDLVRDMNAGAVSALLIYGVNPGYSLPNAEEFIAGLGKVETTVSFSSHADETATHCKFVCPDNHYLESWNDFYPQTGQYGIAQPTISRLYETRQAQESLLRWAGNRIDFLSYMRGVWNEYHSSMGQMGAFDDFWNNAVRTGGFAVPTQNAGGNLTFQGDLTAAARAVENIAGEAGGFEVVLYSKVGIGDGRHATNPWLLELPDPVTRISWDNYITMSAHDVKEMGLKDQIGQEWPASVVEVKVNDKSVELPVYPMPGQKRGTIGIALGYGRGSRGENVGKAAFYTGKYGGHEKDENGQLIPVGKNVFPLVKMVDNSFAYTLSGAEINPTGGTFPLAATQIQHTLMDRESVVKETTLQVYKSSEKEVYNPAHKLAVHEDGENIKKPVSHINIWEEFPIYEVGHRWGLSIDLSTCIGCSACVTACHTENNVPVVGKDEIRRGRDMHWLRIDRYFSSDMNKEKGKEEGKSTIGTYREMEVPSADNPGTVFMPMLCQHCNHAPCETVCPVAATTHSSEGLNQMTYNRCIGTRYCANNCPYKVRRFNWFNYKAYDKFAEVNPAQDSIMRMVLNPDVTVRSRGVMEKCSLCVQRIQYGKLEAKKSSKPVEDGSIQTACAEACPTNAIIFGDLNDKNSHVRKKFTEDRSYYALEEVGTRPNVSYQVKIRNHQEA